LSGFSLIQTNGWRGILLEYECEVLLGNDSEGLEYDSEVLEYASEVLDYDSEVPEFDSDAQELQILLKRGPTKVHGFDSRNMLQ
jgi:hypothetical protein